MGTTYAILFVIEAISAFACFKACKKIDSSYKFIEPFIRIQPDKEKIHKTFGKIRTLTYIAMICLMIFSMAITTMLMVGFI